MKDMQDDPVEEVPDLLADWISREQLARALGLDAGPMTGFDNGKVDEAFFAGTPIRSNILVNLGQGDPASIFPRSPRLGFDEAARIL